MSVSFVLFVAGLGLVDSLNPATIAVAIVLSATEKPVRRLLGYAVGIFAVYFGGGLVLTLGPSEIVRTVSKPPDSDPFDIGFIVAGVLALGFAAWLVVHRNDPAKVPDVSRMKARSAVALGAGMTAVDLPTAFPYFAAIVAILGERLPASEEIALLLLFNLAYVAPIVAIAVVAKLMGPRAEPILARVREFVQKWSPIVLAVLSGGVGIALIVSGVTGLV